MEDPAAEAGVALTFARIERSIATTRGSSDILAFMTSMLFDPRSETILIHVGGELMHYAREEHR